MPGSGPPLSIRADSRAILAGVDAGTNALTEPPVPELTGFILRDARKCALLPSERERAHPEMRIIPRASW